MSTRDMALLWSTLSAHADACVDLLLAADGGAPPAAAGAHASAIGELEAVVALVRVSVGAEGVALCAQLVHTAAGLHDIIFELEADDVSGLQDEIVCMCEAWWLAGRAGREALVPQAVAYVLVRALGADASNADVKRVAAIRGALGAIEFETAAATSLKKLLLHALICPRFLRHADGRRFLVGLFALSERLVGELHAAIKNQLPVCRPSLRAAYGDVYARAWKAAPAASAAAAAIEGAIQELMLAAAHARTSAMASALRATLAPVHALQGTAPAADAMLGRLYAPILWRGLKAPNPLVRRNSAALLFDVFPLQPAGGEGGRARADEERERQWAVVAALLADDVPSVRALAAHGAARALALYGGDAPAGVSKAIVTRLAAELAHDAASAAVRVAALEGLRFLVESAVSPAVDAESKTSKKAAAEAAAAAAAASEASGGATMACVRGALPLVGSLAHDSCERVRAALFALLGALRQLRAPAWTAVVAPELLARRLPLERAATAKGLAALVATHYLPAAAAGAKAGFAKLLALLREQPLVACALLERAPAVVKASTLCRLVQQLVRETEAAIGGGAAEAAAKADAADALAAPLLALATLLDAEAAGPAAAHARRASAAAPSKLCAETLAALPAELADTLWAAAHGSELARGALRRIAARLPEGAMPAVTTAVTAECAAVLAAPGAAPADGGAGADGADGILACVCAWDRAGALLQAVSAALVRAPAVDVDAADGGGAARAGKRGRAAVAVALENANDDERLASAGHAAGLLLQLLGSARVRDELLASAAHRAALGRTLAQLGDWMTLDEVDIGGAGADARLRLVRARAKLALHLATLPVYDDDASAPVEQPPAAKPSRGGRKSDPKTTPTPEQPVGVGGARETRAAGEAALRELMRWGSALVATAGARQSSALADANGGAVRASGAQPKSARSADAAGGGRATALACAALVVCADTVVEMAALGLCSARAAADALPPRSTAAAVELAEAGTSLVLGAMRLCATRAGGLTALCMQRRALALAWQLLDGSAGGEGSHEAALAIRLALAAGASRAAEAEGEHQHDSHAGAASRELRAGIGSLLALAAHAPQLSPAPLVEGLLHALLADRSLAASADGENRPPAAARESEQPPAGGKSDGPLGVLRLEPLALASAEVRVQPRVGRHRRRTPALRARCSVLIRRRAHIPPDPACASACFWGARAQALARSAKASIVIHEALTRALGSREAQAADAAGLRALGALRQFCLSASEADPACTTLVPMSS